jgi:integrase
MARNSKLPQIRFHKTTRQAYVRLDGTMVYRGPATPNNVSLAVKRRYDETIARWLAGRSADPYGIIVGELAVRYFEHARQHYRKNGKETSEVTSIRSALRLLVKADGTTRVQEYGPLKFQALRTRMIDAGWRRKSINKQIGRIRRMFKWGVSQELVPTDTLVALNSVAGLRAGRSKAIESAPVLPVSEAAIEAVRPHVSRPIWAMIQLQLVTGMRPGEVTIMRGCDITMSGSVWEYTPASHKTEHHGRQRIVMLGPKAQLILREFFRSDITAYLFSPVDARMEFDEQRRENRKTPMTPSQMARQRASQPKRKPGDCYTVASYGQAIRKACENVFGMPQEFRNVSMKLPPARRDELKKNARAWREEHCWSPNQLRHTAATEIRREFGIEAAQNTLGHSSPAVTLIYAERSLEQVREVMEKLG